MDQLNPVPSPPPPPLPPASPTTLNSSDGPLPPTGSRWNLGWAFAVMGIYIGAQFAAALAVGVAIGVAYGIWAGTQGKTISPTTIQEIVMLPAVVASIVVSTVAGVWASLLWGRTQLRLSEPTGFGWVSTKTSWLVVGLLIGAGWSVVYLVVAPLFLKPPPPEMMGPLSKLATGNGGGRWVWLFLALVAPPVEEYLFRGVFASGLRTKLGFGLSTLIVTICFTSLHLAEILPYWPAFVAIAGLSVATSVLRERSGSLFPGIALHFSYNLTMSCAVFLNLGP